MYQYFLESFGKPKGPYSVEELKKLEITRDALVWRVGLPKWVKINELKELNELADLLPPSLKVKNKFVRESMIFTNLLIVSLIFGIVISSLLFIVNDGLKYISENDKITDTYSLKKEKTPINDIFKIYDDTTKNKISLISPKDLYDRDTNDKSLTSDKNLLSFVDQKEDYERVKIINSRNNYEKIKKETINEGFAIFVILFICIAGVYYMSRIGAWVIENSRKTKK